MKLLSFKTFAYGLAIVVSFLVKSLLVIAFFHSLTKAQPPVEAIFYGDPIPAAHPSTVLLFFHSTSKVYVDHFCSGTFVTHQTILTAGHCVTQNTTGVHVLLTQDIYGPILWAKSWRRPQKWGTTLNDIINDVGVVKLAEYIGDVQPIPVTFLKPKKGQNVELRGYGLDETGHNLTEKTAKMHVVSVGAVNFDVESSKQRACFGDSGGPVLIRVRGRAPNTFEYRIMGVISLAPDSTCSTPWNGIGGMFSTYTKTWVEQAIAPQKLP